MKRFASWVVVSVLVLSGCEEPCKQGYAKRGRKCEMLPIRDAGPGDAAVDMGASTASDSGTTEPDSSADASDDNSKPDAQRPGLDAATDASQEAVDAGVTCSVTCDPVASCLVATDTCECPSGYDDTAGDGSECAERDECALNEDNCHPNADCENLPGTFACSCKAGFNGDGVNACQANTVCADAQGSNCSPQATCQKVSALDYCVCSSGYAGNGSSCSDVDECKLNNGDCGNPTYFKCSNQVGGPPACTDINECLEANGGCDALVACNNLSPGRSCGACPAGYTGSGETGCAPGLTGLLLSTGTLSPAFDIATTSYQVILPITTQTIALTPSAPFGTSITVLGQTVTSGQPWSSPALNLNDNTVSIVVSQSGRPSRTYTVTVTRGQQQAYVKSSNSESSDVFGTSVAISGDTMVVGAPGEDSSATSVGGNQNINDAAGSGAAYVFVRSGSTWTQQAYLKASNAKTGDGFGKSVAIDGDTIVVGAPDEDACAATINATPASYDCAASGAAYVFARAGSVWSQQAYLKYNAMAGYRFGASVAVSGSRAVIGIPAWSGGGPSGLGAVQTYARTGVAWAAKDHLPVPYGSANDAFGTAVAVAGDILVAGAPGEDSCAVGIGGNTALEDCPSSGATYAYRWNGSNWVFEAYIKASNTGQYDNFGASLSIAGSSLIVGAAKESSSASGVNGLQTDNAADRSGAAYVFVRSGAGVWSQQAYLKASNTGANDEFGQSVSISGDMAVVGAPNEDGPGSGLGAPTGEGGSIAGAVYAFARTGNSWRVVAYVKAGDASAGDMFGQAVAASQETFVVGAPYEDSATRDIGPSGGTDSAADSSGAAYVFR